MPKGDNLTPKQEKFVQGLFAGLSQRSAYKQAYDAENMSDITIDQRAFELARNSKVKVRLAELHNTASQKTEWTVEKLIKKFEKIAEKSLQEEPVLDRNGKPTGEFRYDSAGANKAMENIGKLLGMYTEKVVSKNENINQNMEMTTAEADRIIEKFGSKYLKIAK